MKMSMVWAGRKHWQLTVGRWHLCRWCHGAPCRSTGRGPHPLDAFRSRRG